ncbi:hypothetical protein D3C87_2095940 [compost metagenome]
MQILGELGVDWQVKAIQAREGLAGFDTRIERQVERRRIPGQTREEEDERQQADDR